MPLNLLPPRALLKTGSLDHADWNFRPFLGRIQSLRFKLVLSLFPPYRVPRLLEVGYGSGVFMPELAPRARELYGIDIHDQEKQVAEVLVQHDISARLFQGDVTHMAFPDNFFDAVIAVSTLEFVNDQESACQELKRVLTPDGFLIVVTPGHSPVVDLGLRILTGKKAQEDFQGRRESLVPTLERHFSLERRLTAPPPIGS